MSLWKHLKKYDKADLEKLEKENLSEAEDKDILPMILAAFLTLWLPSLLILVGLCVLVMFFFRVL